MASGLGLSGSATTISEEGTVTGPEPQSQPCASTSAEPQPCGSTSAGPQPQPSASASDVSDSAAAAQTPSAERPRKY